MTDHPEKITSNLTFSLFARPSFIEGMARVFDLAQSLEAWNSDKTADQADRRALGADWRATGEDIRAALNTYGRRTNEQARA